MKRPYLFALTVPALVVALLVFDCFQERTSAEICRDQTSGYMVVEARCANLPDLEWLACKERIYWAADRFSWARIVEDYCKFATQDKK